ncbi:MAG: Uma2 family endonuclease, partial [Phormidesmis sp.]
RTRYESYQDYLDDESLSPDGDYRLLSTGELIEVPPEDDDNINVAYVLGFLIGRLSRATLVNLIRPGTKEIQVNPVGDKQVNRKPDLLVLHPEHREVAKSAILFGMKPPLFVAETVSPGGENSTHYKRDYIWKRQQYEEWRIPEYWIVDRHRAKITVLVLVDGRYQESVYTGKDKITSTIFPELTVMAEDCLSGVVK